MHGKHEDAAPPPRELRAPPRANTAANTVAFAVLFVISVAFLFASYCMARALIGGFGAGVGTIAGAVAATAAASIFLWWLAPFADFAEIFWLHLPADRRARRGECPHCGYPHGGRARCNECGESTAPLPAWTLSPRPVRRMARILVPALLAGAAAGEAWMRLDEARFVREYESARVPYTRERAFPTGFARMWADESGGLHSESWPAFERDRRWTRPAVPGTSPAPTASEPRQRGW
jgi:hypothetical protein